MGAGRGNKYTEGGRGRGEHHHFRTSNYRTKLDKTDVAWRRTDLGPFWMRQHAALSVLGKLGMVVHTYDPST